ncbi:MAG: hypothetical protein IAF00_01175 [Phycisphaerales bacterium]|nr:hypothetical protein [Phycisphaerales bacterium]
MKLLSALILALAPTVVGAGQTMYKCPDPSGTARFQQMPCSPTGGGEAVTVKSIPSGAGSGISDDAKNYMQERDKYWEERDKAAAEESKRQEESQAERNKVPPPVNRQQPNEPPS